MNIRLHIERLVLGGSPVTRGEVPRVKAAMEAELTRLLTAGGVSSELAAGGAMPMVNAVDIRVSAAPSRLGTQIAQSVYAGIGKR
jgi:hypothetical protein